MRDLKTFAGDESGAITVDWVVLTAAIVGLGLAVLVVVSGGVEDLGTDIASDVGAIDPVTDPFNTNDTEVATYD